MEGLSTKVYNGVKCYWKTRGYQRLGTSTSVPDRHGAEESGTRRRRRKRKLFRLRISRRLKLNPRKWYIGARDAYVRIMMKLANTSVVRSRTMAGYNGDGFGRPSQKEYDEKMIYEIYKTLSVAQHKQHRIPSQVACSV
ncbi:hypothetical protein CTI12_AA243600 [Artemisia annua]|uniref:Uncharacterized protein n=1 Tax=Artemisia annua TaxID=35608 RepID=A0A2U1MXG6_ARTAN|nr:hypothetical protein CTI12_AA243600 [Artemisia annua]